MIHFSSHNLPVCLKTEDSFVTELWPEKNGNIIFVFVQSQLCAHQSLSKKSAVHGFGTLTGKRLKTKIIFWNACSNLHLLHIRTDTTSHASKQQTQNFSKLKLIHAHLQSYLTFTHVQTSTLFHAAIVTSFKKLWKKKLLYSGY